MRTLTSYLTAFAAFGSLVLPAHSTPNEFDRTTYLAQARRAGPEEVVARNFLLKALVGQGFYDPNSIIGVAAPAINAWIDGSSERCTPPGTEVELTCKTRGLIDSMSVVYVASPDKAREWAVLRIHTSPDDGNVGRDRIALFRKGPTGYVFQAVVDTRGYQPGNFADNDGTMTYVGFTGTPGEAMEGAGPRERFRIVGAGTTATVVADTNSHATPRTIVGTWAPNPRECTPVGGMVTVRPKAVFFGDDWGCSFDDVARAGNVVTWHGVCETHARPDDPSTVVAEQRGRLLYIRVNGAQNGPFLRCTPPA